MFCTAWPVLVLLNCSSRSNSCPAEGFSGLVEALSTISLASGVELTAPPPPPP